MSSEEDHSQDPSAMTLSGTPLTPEETAAAMMVVGMLSAAQPETSEDRERERARRFSHRRRVSTWSREGAAHWRVSAGED